MNNQNVNALLAIDNERVKSKIVSEELLLDLKVLIKEYYLGTFTNDGQSLNLSFFNGQKFVLKIEEIA